MGSVFENNKNSIFRDFLSFKIAQIFIAINYRPPYGIRVKIFHLCPWKMLLFPWQAVQQGLQRSQEDVDPVDYTTHLIYQREVLISFKAISPELSYTHCLLTSLVIQSYYCYLKRTAGKACRFPLKLSQQEIFMVNNPKCPAKEKQSKGKFRFWVVSIRDLV